MPRHAHVSSAAYAPRMSAGEIVTLVLAVWGAGLSTFLAVQRGRRRIRLVLTPVIVSGNVTEDLWAVRAINVRERPVEITMLGLTREGRRIQERHVTLGKRPPAELPVVLGDGQSVEVYFSEPDGLVEETTVDGAWALDTLNRLHRCRYPPRNPRARFKQWRRSRKTERLRARLEGREPKRKWRVR